MSSKTEAFCRAIIALRTPPPTPQSPKLLGYKIAAIYSHNGNEKIHWLTEKGCFDFLTWWAKGMEIKRPCEDDARRAN